MTHNTQGATLEYRGYVLKCARMQPGVAPMWHVRLADARKFSLGPYFTSDDAEQAIDAKLANQPYKLTSISEPKVTP
jgi:hypothetical protein